MNVLKIRNWKLANKKHTPEDMHNCSVEIWAGEFDALSPFSFQVDKVNFKYRFNPFNGSEFSYSEWRDLKEIDLLLKEEVKAFEWDFVLRKVKSIN